MERWRPAGPWSGLHFAAKKNSKWYDCYTDRRGCRQTSPENEVYVAATPPLQDRSSGQNLSFSAIWMMRPDSPVSTMARVLGGATVEQQVCANTVER